MKKKVEYTDGPIGKIRRVKDFLPSPEELIKMEENMRVTLNLRRSSVNYFKKVAKDNHTKYQKVIRTVLDQYSGHFAKAS